jgi:predicted amidohydrolase
MSTPDLTITVIQTDTVWHDPAANRATYQARFDALDGHSDIIVLPETFTSGFSNEAIGQAETMQGETLAWLSAQAKLRNAAITGSVQIRDGENVFNRMLWAMPDGAVLHYDKRHLFRMANEHQRYAPGADKVFIDYKGWRICPLVCYDLRFPVYSRNRFDHTRADGYDYDLLIYVANWPSPRHFAWQTLLKARAIENQCYVVGVNRVGSDGNGLDYLGGSTVLDFTGQTLIECGTEAQYLSTAVSQTELTAFRQRFPFYLDADQFTLKD